jgi:hypothetical protein
MIYYLTNVKNMFQHYLLKHLVLQRLRCVIPSIHPYTYIHRLPTGGREGNPWGGGGYRGKCAPVLRSDRTANQWDSANVRRRSTAGTPPLLHLFWYKYASSYKCVVWFCNCTPLFNYSSRSLERETRWWASSGRYVYIYTYTYMYTVYINKYTWMYVYKYIYI